VLTLKEVGDPRDIGTYFQMWNEGHCSRHASFQPNAVKTPTTKLCDTPAHPFFLEGYTLMGNGEDTFFQKNKTS